MHHKRSLSIGEITPGSSRLIYGGVIAVCMDIGECGFAGTNDKRYPKLWTSQIKLRRRAYFRVRPSANVEKDDGKNKRIKNYADKNNAKVAEIGHAEEKTKKKKKRKTKEEIPVMNGGCSRFNESPRWSSTEIKRVDRIGHAEEKTKKKKKRKTKEEIPVMNGGCSRFNESPRWSSTEIKRV
ncbi:Uncharacterized protein DBV15_02366 [Temnothorax longispinosus]|uniref:Uncharacterized protein n=1 Tax=Temnothorax longispinosus TaxID=300112 RepID=A0A4S2JRT2_9HYME|nr:Uncharacterized protein DBV15_02366 [Temnothorax longispinosus]